MSCALTRSGCFGNSIVETPNIDQLAQSRCSLLTMFRHPAHLYPQPRLNLNRLLSLGSAIAHGRLLYARRSNDSCLGRWRLKGYRTASIGKMHLVPQAAEPEVLAQALASDDGTYYGFQEVDLVNGHGSRCFGNRYTSWLRERVPDLDERQAKPMPYAKGVNCWRWNLPEEVHSSHYIAERAIDFLETAADAPFFLHVSFPDPHYPFTLPQPWASLYNPAEMPPPIPPVSESVDMPELHERVYRGPQAPASDSGRPRDRVIGTPPHNYAKYGPRRLASGQGHLLRHGFPG